MKKSLCLRGVMVACLFGAMVLAPACSENVAPGPVLCTSDATCPDGEICSHGACHPGCVTSDTCPKGEVCVSGACLTGCTTDKDCGKGEECKDGYCVPKGQNDGGPGDGDGGTKCIDKDGDGYGVGCALGPDCNDDDPTIHPGATEICDDGIDNDCDGKTDKDDPDCKCKTGQVKVCYTGPGGTEHQGICHPGLSQCGADGFFGPCVGEQKPTEDPEITCDGLDNNCDGRTDEGLKNACGGCGPVPDEICGNGLDDNCNKQIDENCSCDPHCQCDPLNPGHDCVCHPPTHQDCYSGPPATLGFGPCKGGFHDCQKQPDGSYAWTECVGEVLPSPECAGGLADGIDNNCDGFTDEGCPVDKDGDTYSPPEDCDDNDPNVHPGATEVCNGKDDNCNGLIDEGVANACGGCGPVPDEICGDGLDNNCNGEIDEGCGGCTGSQTKPCYRGPPNTAGVGECKWGTMTCNGEFWSECSGDVLPQPEKCDDTKDYNCDGKLGGPGTIGANSCGDCGGVEICDGKDNDCDGLTDEGLRNACGQCLTCATNDDCPVGAKNCDPVLKKCLETDCDGLDNNCDGLTDEGLLNSCGKCGDSCYGQNYGGPGHGSDWGKGTSDGVSNNNNPDELQLDSTTQSPHFIWIAGSNVLCNSAHSCLTNPGCYAGQECDTVWKYDTRTNALIGVYSSWGWSPSRTAVAIDNTVWVGNRGCHDLLSNCDPSNAMHGNAVHLDADGNLICRADVTCGSGTSDVAVRAVTIDKDGNAWLGCWQNGHIYKYSGKVEDTDTTLDPPRCKLLADINLGGSHAYGAAVDSNGMLWISTLGSGALRKIDTATATLLPLTVSPGYSTYGMAIDKNNDVWYGNWSGGAPGVIKVNGATGAVTPVNRTIAPLSGATRGVTVDHDGNIWVAEWSNNTVSKFAPDGTHLGQWSVAGMGMPASGPLGMGVDFDNNIWAISYTSGHASKFAPDGTLLAVFPVVGGNSPYTYSDMTGYQLRSITLKFGTWTVDFDSGYDNAQWYTLQWDGTMAADDQIRVRARTAATEGALASATWSPYHDGTPPQGPWTADIHSEVPRGRWVQVEVTLTTQDNISPAFSDLQVFWAY